MSESKQEIIILENQGTKRKEPIEKEKEEEEIIYPIVFGKRKSVEEEKQKKLFIDTWQLLLKSKDWKELLDLEFKKESFYSTIQKLEKLYQSPAKIYPKKEKIFEAFNLCPLSKLKCIIIGQDPYHGEGQAHGLSFSVTRNIINIPPSLKNIFTELNSDLGIEKPSHGCLDSWAEQGVLLLNATLTVEAGKANSHKDIGWQIFTSSVLKVLNQKTQNLVFILWGKFAQSMATSIDTRKHCIISAGHPSPKSEDQFFGCKVFSKANQYLKSKSIEPIDWKISD